MDTPLKRCSQCGRDLPRTLDFFYRDAHTKVGLAYVSKACIKARVKAWEQAYPERKAAKARRYYHAHQAQETARQRWNYYRRKARDAGE